MATGNLCQMFPVLCRNGLMVLLDNFSLALVSCSHISQYAQKTRVGSKDVFWATRNCSKSEIMWYTDADNLWNELMSTPLSCRSVSISTLVTSYWSAMNAFKIQECHILLTIISLLFIPHSTFQRFQRFNHASNLLDYVRCVRKDLLQHSFVEWVLFFGRKVSLFTSFYSSWDFSFMCIYRQQT